MKEWQHRLSTYNPGLSYTREGGDQSEKLEVKDEMLSHTPQPEPLRAHRSDQQHQGAADDAQRCAKRSRGRAEPAVVDLKRRILKKSERVRGAAAHTLETAPPSTQK